MEGWIVLTVIRHYIGLCLTSLHPGTNLGYWYR